MLSHYYSLVRFYSSPAADTLPGYILFRHTLDPNRFQGDNSLDFFTSVLPTPGSIPMAVVPELNSLVLLITGIIVLGYLLMSYRKIEQPPTKVGGIEGRTESP